MVDFIKVLLVAFMTLFPVVNPIGDAPIFLALTQQYPQAAQRILARKIAAYGFVLLAVSFVFGSIILDFFGISLNVVQIAGGLVVAATGWSLLNQKDSDSTASQAPATVQDALEHAFYPLTLPITVGPGCLDRHHARSTFKTPSWTGVGTWLSPPLPCSLDGYAPSLYPRGGLLRQRRPPGALARQVRNNHPDPTLRLHFAGHWGSDHVERIELRHARHVFVPVAALVFVRITGLS